MDLKKTYIFKKIFSFFSFLKNKLLSIKSIVFSFVHDFYIGKDDKVDYPNKVYWKASNNLKKIWNCNDVGSFGLERQFRIFLSLLTFIMPGTFVRYVLGFFHNKIYRRIGIEYYSILKVVLLLLFFYFDLTTNKFILLISFILFIDTLHFLFTRIFLSDMLIKPMNYKRSLILTSINFIEINLAFAFMYSFIDDFNTSEYSLVIERTNLNDFETIYMSFANAATIGYYTPASEIVIIITIFQIFIDLFFMIVIFSSVMNKIK